MEQPQTPLQQLLQTKWQTKNKLLVVNFIGSKGSGKDTCATLLADELGLDPEVYNISFAKELKDLCWHLYGKKIKDPSRIYGDITKKEEKITDWAIDETLRKRFSVLRQHTYWTGRLVLQFMGTDIGRAMWSNVWIEGTIERIRKIQELDLPICFTTDCRFHDEHHALEKLGQEENFTNVFVRIDRPSLVHKDGHASESNWKHMAFDHQIWNDSDLPSLQTMTYDILEGLLKYECS